MGLLRGGLVGREAPVGDVYAGYKALGRGEAEEDGEDAEDDGREAEAAAPEKVADNAEGGADGPDGDVGGAAQEGGDDAAHAEKDADEAGEPAAQQLGRLFAAGAHLLLGSAEVPARLPGIVPVLAQKPLLSDMWFETRLPDRTRA